MCAVCWGYVGLMAAAKSGKHTVPELTTLEYTIAEKDWVPDAMSPACYKCKAGFDNTNRRHHCRMCGQCFDARCSDHHLKLPISFDDHKKLSQSNSGLENCRVCDACFAQITRYRQFITELSAPLQTNLTFIATYQEFLLYDSGSASTSTTAHEVWLSGSMQLICFRHSAGGSIKSYPVHMLESVSDGLTSPDFKARCVTTSCGCLTSENKELLSRASRCFSLIFSDGRSMDIELKTPVIKQMWFDRFRMLQKALVPLATYHANRGWCPVQALEKKEAQRIRDLQTQLQGERIAAKKSKMGGSNRAAIAEKYSKRSSNATGSSAYQKMDDD